MYYNGQYLAEEQDVVVVTMKYVAPYEVGNLPVINIGAAIG